MLKFITSGEEIKSFYANLGFLLLRIFVGLSIAFTHGINKIPPSERFIESVSDLGFPVPAFFAWAAGFSEFFGGLLLVSGLATRPSTFFLSITMTVAVLLRHANDPFSTKEKPLLFLMIFILLFLAGSGKYSLDYFLRKRFNS